MKSEREGAAVTPSLIHATTSDDRPFGGQEGCEELDEFLVAVMRHATPDDRAVEDVERSKQGGRAVAFLIMCHRPAFAGFERQARLSAVERLDLGLLVDRDDGGMGGRVHVEADDVSDLGGELRIVRLLEGPQAMGRRLATL